MSPIPPRFDVRLSSYFSTQCCESGPESSRVVRRRTLFAPDWWGTRRFGIQIDVYGVNQAVVGRDEHPLYFVYGTARNP
jgi:hypothetical protein